MAQYRNIILVLNAVQALIPSDDQTALRDRLEKIKKDAEYRAPEACQEFWIAARVVLTEELGEPAGVPWKEQIASVIAGKAPLSAHDAVEVG